MSSKPKKKREHRSKPPPEDPGPQRPFAKKNFAPPRPFPSSQVLRPQPIEEREVVEQRAGDYVPHRGHVSGGTRTLLRDAGRPLLAEPLREAISRSGHHGVERRVYKAAEVEAGIRAAEERKPKLPPVGSLVLDDQMLRRAYNAFDIGKREVVGAKELKHLFAQLGEMPKDCEIDGMIQLCDMRGDGVVSFEDFLAIFSNPTENLRGVDVATLREVFNGNGKPGEGEESEEESESEDDESSSGSGSSLEPRGK